MNPVVSGHIEAVSDLENGIIEVHYKGGTKYHGTCTAEKHAEIMGAESVGKALAASGIKLTRIKEL